MGIMLPPFHMPIVRPPVEVSDTYLQGATFTVTLGSLVENHFDLDMQHYPIFDEEYRDGLNAKIIEHYWFREIGLETPQLFKRFLNRRMNEIMPLYNMLYKTQLDENDAFINTDLYSKRDGTADMVRDESSTKDETSSTNTDTTSDNKSDASSRALVSQTPQMQLSGNEDYASSLTDTRSDSSSKGSGNTKSNGWGKSNALGNAHSKTTEDYLTHVAGLQGITKANAIMQLRQTFLNIDMLVIDDLQDLFMDVYNDYANFL